MTDIPVHLRSDHGVPFAPVAVFPAAGLRSRSPGRHDSLLALIPWALLCRIAVSAGCFAGGLLIAPAVALDIVSEAAACGICAVTAPFVWLVVGFLVPLSPFLVNRMWPRLARALPLPPVSDSHSPEEPPGVESLVSSVPPPTGRT